MSDVPPPLPGPLPPPPSLPNPPPATPLPPGLAAAQPLSQAVTTPVPAPLPVVVALDPPPLPGPRPTIKQIMSEIASTGSKPGGMDQKQLADMLGPLAGLTGGKFLFAMKAGEAIGERLHLRATRKYEEVLPYGYVAAVRAMALALGSLKHEILALFDTPRGSVIEARMNASFFTMGGSLIFEIIEENTAQVRIAATSEVKAQIVDYGEGQHVMKNVVEKAQRFLELGS